MTVTESEWDDEQVALLVASTQRQNGLNRYGIPYAIATDKAYADKIQVDLVIDYVERAVEHRQKEYTGPEYSKSDQAGWLWEAHVDEA